MSDLMESTRKIVADATQKLSPVEYVKQQVAQMDRSDVEALAAAYLMIQVKGRMRRNVLVIERDAGRTPTAPKEPAWGTPAWDRWADLPENIKAAESTRKLRREYAEIDRRHRAELMASWKVALEKYKSELHTEWTRDLLDAEFATGDGNRVRWGQATREQHEERARMHARNAQAGMEGYARHQQAVEVLERTGAACLYEAVGVAA